MPTRSVAAMSVPRYAGPLRPREADASDAGTPGQIVVRRYRLRERLGGGGFGTVWLADDAVSGEEVAVKLLHRLDGPSAREFRREAALLRVLKLPGVVRILDDGESDGTPFLVMERVHGKPFPAERRGWEAIRPLADELVTSLARLHRVGVVHGDIKPANVLVAESGRVTVVDFGVSLGPGELTRRSRGGTPTYWAPEQAEGVVTEATDLHALGVMLFEAVAGRLPRVDEDCAASLRSHVPSNVAATIARMRSPVPEERPSIAEVNTVLFGRSDRPRVATTNASLEALFHGPDRVLHLQRDGARELRWHAESNGRAPRAELARWVRDGRCHWDGPRVRIDREALDLLAKERLAADPASPAAPFAAALRGSAPAVALEVAERIGADAIAGADGSVALPVLLEALRVARSEGVGASDSLVSAAVCVAFDGQTPAPVDALVYELELHPRSAMVTHVLQLLSAVTLVRHRERTAERALAAAISVAAFEDVYLERLRRAVHFQAGYALPPDAHAELGEAQRAWAEQHGGWIEALACDWLGLARYRQGRFDEAAALHARAACPEYPAKVRWLGAANRAKALIECARLPEVVAVGGTIEAEAPLPSQRLYGAAMADAAGYRMRDGEGVDESLAEVAFTSPNIAPSPLVLVTQAARAWRAGDEARATHFAATARAIFLRRGQAAAAALADALCVACGAAASIDPPETAPPRVAAQIRALRDPHLSPSDRGPRAEILSASEYTPHTESP